MQHITPLWAAGIDGELIAGAIGVVIVIGGWIVNQIKEANDAAKQRQKQRQQQAASGQTMPGPSTSAPSTGEDLVQRRRRQLEQMMRRQGMAGSATPASGPAVDQPQNMSMDEMRRRAKARAEYERRAAMLRQQQAQAHAQAHATAPQPVQQAPVLRAPTAQPAPVDPTAEQIRRRQAELARRQQRARQAQQAAKAKAAQAAKAQARPTAVPAGTTSVSEVVSGVDHQIDYGESVVHRHVADAEGVAKASRARLAGLSNKSLRQAILWREILDRPVGMRGEREEG